MSRDKTAIQIQDEVIRPIQTLIDAHTGKKIWVDGISTVIVGRVNAGKSSLLNLLLNEQRAIVTPVPGTTRDIIESPVTIEGLPLRLMDTAGFREARDEVEEIGIHLTRKRLKDADFLLVVIDQSHPLNQDDLKIIDQARQKKTLIVINKMDLPSAIDQHDRQNAFTGFPVVEISALTGQGLDNLRKAVADCLLKGDIDIMSSHVAPNLRHKQALTHAHEFFNSACKNTKEDHPMEIVALELKSGLDALGSITGETTSDEVLDSIFSRFCLGK